MRKTLMSVTIFALCFTLQSMTANAQTQAQAQPKKPALTYDEAMAFYEEMEDKIRSTLAITINKAPPKKFLPAPVKSLRYEKKQKKCLAVTFLRNLAPATWLFTV